jgi:hypothetical protein
MTLVLPDVGEGLMLKNFLNFTAPQDWSLRLYQNNITPAETDVASTYTVSSWTGYANVTLTGANWTVTTGAPSAGDYAQQSFTSSANQTVQQTYGYYLVQTTSGLLGWAERFSDGPYPIANNGDIIRITPHIEVA